MAILALAVSLLLVDRYASEPRSIQRVVLSQPPIAGSGDRFDHRANGTLMGVVADRSDGREVCSVDGEETSDRVTITAHFCHPLPGTSLGSRAYVLQAPLGDRAVVDATDPDAEPLRSEPCTEVSGGWCHEGATRFTRD